MTAPKRQSLSIKSLPLGPKLLLYLSFPSFLPKHRCVAKAKKAYELARTWNEAQSHGRDDFGIGFIEEHVPHSGEVPIQAGAALETVDHAIRLNRAGIQVIGGGAISACGSGRHYDPYFRALVVVERAFSFGGS